MPLLFQDKELMELMSDFYTLTGIRIVLFDSDCNELFSYPTNKKTFCSHMRQNEKFNQKCLKCDREAFKKCDESKSLEVYKCHSGLLEAVSPIVENKKIIGYLMFGQVTDYKNKQELLREINVHIEQYSPCNSINDFIRKIKYKSNKQILAAAKILDAITEYILLKEIVKLSNRQIIEKIDLYIDNHLSEDISVGVICEEFDIGRTKLYDIVSQYTNLGVASYIRQRRLKKAKHLLKTTDLKISEISDAIGFSDYNYFLRVFKKEFGISPKQLYLNNH